MQASTISLVSRTCRPRSKICLTPEDGLQPEEMFPHGHFQALVHALILCKNTDLRNPPVKATCFGRISTCRSPLVQRLKTRIGNIFTSATCTALSFLFCKPLAGGWRELTMHFTVEQFNAILLGLIMIAGKIQWSIPSFQERHP